MPHDNPLLSLSLNRLIRHGTIDDVPALIALDTYATQQKKAGFVPSGQIDNLDEDDPELVYVKFVR